ncbi:FliA/WhiG family RNA polymerase sigma factor [Niallia sp. Krafla_26]
MSKDEQLIWDKWMTTRDEEAGNILIKKYTSLVRYHVQRISVTLPKSVSRDDLYSLGMIGLLDAINKFDFKRDLKFDTYASFRVRGAIIDGLRKEDWLPRGTREKAKKIETIIEKLEQKYMRHVTEEDIARELNISVDEVYTIMNEQFFAHVLSIDDQSDETDEKTGQKYLIKDKNIEQPEEEMIKHEIVKEMIDQISKLSEKEQLVISLFYQEEMTLTEIGQIMGLSTSRISQIHSKCIFKLKGFMEKLM